MIHPVTTYLVYQAEYDYDGSSFTPLLVTHSEIRANEKVEEMKQIKEKVLAAKEKTRAHIEEWFVDHPRVIAKPAKLKSLPDYFGRKGNWTKEQKAEYDAVIKENYTMSIAAAKPAIDWAQAQNEERERFIKTFDLDIQENYFSIDDTSCFEIEVVAFEAE
jgi:hypothetical protein